MTDRARVIPIRPDLAGDATLHPSRDAATSEKDTTRRTFGKVARMRSGRFQASYVVDGQRFRAPVTFDNKSDAGSWLDMRHAELLEHRWKPAPPPERGKELFKDYAARWLDERELKPRTRSEYGNILRGKLLPEFGDRFIRDIEPEDVRQWYRSLDPTKKTARTHAYALMRTIMGTAASDGEVDANPVHIVGAGVGKRVKKIRPATLQELSALTDAMPPRYRAMVLLGSWTALRFGELTELRRRDVDLERGIIHVTRAVAWPKLTGEAGELLPPSPVVGDPKSDAGIRDIYLPPHIVPALLAHLDEHAQPGPDGLLFPNTDGNHLHHGSLYKVFGRARKVAGRPDLRWHDLRHTGATLAAQQGATLAELMDRLGHSTVTAALRYQHAAADRQAEISRRLSALAEGGTV